MKKFLYMAVCMMCLLTAVFFCACQTPHTHRWVLTEEVPATCEKSGGVFYQCECGAKNMELISAKGHDWQEVDVTDTEIFLLCLRCNAKKTEIKGGVSIEENSSDIADSSSSEENSSETVDSSSSEENSSEIVDSSSSEEDSSEIVDSSFSEENSSEIVDSSSSEENSSEIVDSSSSEEDSGKEEDPFDIEAAKKIKFYFEQTKDRSGYICVSLEDHELQKTLRILVLPDEYLGKPVTEIAPRAFAEFPKLNCVYLGKNLKKLGAQSFLNCYNLVEIHNYYGLDLAMDPAAVGEYSHILDHALAVYETPTNSRVSRDENGYVTYSEAGVKQLIGYDGKEKDLVLPADVTGINRDIFLHIEQLESVVIGDKVTKIGMYVFLDCVTLESVTFGEGLRRIELRAFQNCMSLQRAYFAQSYGWGLESGMIFTEAEIAKSWIVGSYLHSEFFDETWVWYGEIYGK